MVRGITRRDFVSAAAAGLSALMLPSSNVAALSLDEVALYGVDIHEIQEVVTSFLESYFMSLSSSGSVTPVDFHFIDNDELFVVKTANEWQRQCMLLMGYTYEDVVVSVDYGRISIASIESVTVDADLNMTFRYSHIAPGEVVSGLRASFQVDLGRGSDGAWAITGISSDYDALIRFRDKTISVRADKQRTSDNRHAAELAMTDLLQEDRTFFAQVASELAQSQGAATQYNVDTPQSDEPPNSRGTCSYTKANGVLYARKYATNPTRIFYTFGSDCTNFTSQCVWAAYGGWDANAAVMTSYINNRKYMNDNGNMNTGWFGHQNGSSNPWGNVAQFWSNAISTQKPYGYTRIGAVQAGSAGMSAIKQISIGDVIQMGQYSSCSEHGVYVTSQNGTGSMTGVLICCHSIDRLDWTLNDLLYQRPQGMSTYIRVMAFNTATLTT